MSTEINDLKKLALQVEKECYYPHGRFIDGAVYTYRPAASKLVDLALPLLGGLDKVEEMIKKRQAKEPLADPDCGNWLLWTILNEIGVSREKS